MNARAAPSSFECQHWLGTTAALTVILTQNLKATQRIKRAWGASRRQYPARIFSSVVSSGLWVKMPRGFLVKRSKRASSASYKVRAQEETEPRTEDLPTQTLNTSVLDVLEPITESWTSDVTSKHLLEDSGGVIGESVDYAQSYFSYPEQSASSPRNSTDSYSPIKPISTELFDRRLQLTSYGRVILLGHTGVFNRASANEPLWHEVWHTGALIGAHLPCLSPVRKTRVHGLRAQTQTTQKA